MDFKFEIGDRVRSTLQDYGVMTIHDRRPGGDPKWNMYDVVHEDGHMDKAGWYEYGLELVLTIAEEYMLAVQYLGEDYFA
jgi:hypothetical protein